MKKKWFNDEGPNRSPQKWLRVMKLTLFFLLAALIHVSASVYSQQTKLSISLQNASVKDVLKSIEDQSEFSFLYKNDNIDVNRLVSIDIQNKSVEELLGELFKGTKVFYEIIDRQIVLVDKEKANFAVPSEQQKSVKGSVTDRTGNPLPGVTVLVKGTTIGTISDVEGNYSLAGLPANANLVFSFIGMKTQEIAVAGKTTLNVTLSEETVKLEELVVVGYGVQGKATLTGAVSSVKNAEIITTKNENVQNMLAGKVAGLRVLQNSSEPGQFNSTIDIRGFGSPLIVIDGVPRTNIARMDPEDIESISVIKDASGSVYGSRAANGVIIVTTKKGQNQARPTLAIRGI